MSTYYLDGSLLNLLDFNDLFVLWIEGSGSVVLSVIFNIDGLVYNPNDYFIMKPSSLEQFNHIRFYFR